MTEDTPKEMDLGARWKEEISTAKRWLQPWHDSGHQILKRLKDKGDRKEGERRVNFFTAEYTTKRAVLYGKTPQASVGRRWKDPDDDLARVGGEMLSRHLNDDIASGDDGYKRALGYVLDDRLSVGLGQARVRYEVETEQETNDASQPAVVGAVAGPPLAADIGRGQDMGLPVRPDPVADLATAPAGAAPTAPPVESKATEAVKVDYVYWGDFLFSPCKYWEVARWVAFGNDMGRKALKRRFNKAKFPTVLVEGDSVPLDVLGTADKKDDAPPPPWARARVWEIWDKEERQVVWMTDGGLVLDVQDDPLGLKDFFPCPRPLVGLTTTDEFIPRPDFVLAQDLYDDLDVLATRMHLLRTALRVVGLYDQSNEALAELINDSAENRMIPVRNYAVLGEKGGIAGAVQFFPLGEVASTLVALTNEFENVKAQLYEITGMSDILRGQGSSVQTTATTDRIKAQFGSARLQAVQDEFADFATALQALKAEVVARQFEPEEIVRVSNMANTADSAMAMDAARFLKDNHETFRVKVQPESLALADFAQTQQERMEVVQVIGQFISTAMPLVQMIPGALPALTDILMWMVASLRGASEIEGVLDRAKAMWAQAQQQPQQGQPPTPDPKLELAKFNAAAKERQIQLEAEVRQKEILTQTAADTRREVVQREQNVLETIQETLIQKMIEQGWTPPGGLGPLPVAESPAPVVPAPMPPPSVPPMGG